MKYYIQFYTLSTGYVEGSKPPRFEDPKPIEACGDRAVVIVDGRVRPATVAKIAQEEGVKRGFVGYKVLKGENLRTAQAVSGYWPLPTHTDRTAESAAYGA